MSNSDNSTDVDFLERPRHSVNPQPQSKPKPPRTAAPILQYTDTDPNFTDKRPPRPYNFQSNRFQTGQTPPKAPPPSLQNRSHKKQTPPQTAPAGDLKDDSRRSHLQFRPPPLTRQLGMGSNNSWERATDYIPPDTFVFFSMVGCSHCTKLKPIWDTFVLASTSPTTLRVVSVNPASESKDDLLAEKYEVVQFPTLMYIDNNGKHEMYHGERNAEAFRKFLSSRGTDGTKTRQDELIRHILEMTR